MARFRFSLRSMLLTVLTLAAAVTLWQNAAPWRIERQFDLESTSDSIDPGRSYTLVFSPDGKWFHADFYGASNDNAYLKCILWNIESGQRTVLIDDAWKESDSIQYYFSEFSADSSLLLAGVSTASHTSLRLWDMRTQSARILTDPPVESVQFAYFHPNNREIVFRLKNRSEQLVDIQTNTIRRKFTTAASLIKLSRRGDRIAWVDIDESIHILDAATLRELHRIEPNPDWRYQYIVHLSADTLYVNAAWTEQRSDYPTKITLKFDLNNPGPAKYIPGELASISPDESLAAFSDTEATRIVDYHKQTEIARFKTNSMGYTEELKWLGHNKLLYSSASRSIYETTTGRIVFTLPNAYSYPFPDGSRVISRKINRADGDEITTAYDMLSGNPLHQWKEGEISRITFAPNSRSFISHHYDNLTLWTRHRPEPWWGLACLPEFWLLLIFSSALLWNLRRDRRPSL